METHDDKVCTQCYYNTLILLQTVQDHYLILRKASIKDQNEVGLQIMSLYY